MALSIFISPADGFNLEASVPGVPGLYPATKIRYRPAGNDLRHRYAEAGRTTEAGAEIIAEQVQSVKVVGDDSKPVTLNATVAATLHAGLYAAYLDHALGFRGPDVAGMEKNSPEV
jgi:hypothetical protein